VDSARLDRVFQACFRRFWHDLLKRGRPNFPALEPARWHTHLVAVRLAVAAAEVGGAAARESWRRADAAWKARVWAGAWEEYRNERGDDPRAWEQAGLPLVTGDGVPPGASLDLDHVDLPAAVRLLASTLGRPDEGEVGE
jgi:hypothetical protein